MTKPDWLLEPGDIVQVTPTKEMFGACLVVVSEVRTWGIQGYVQSAGVDGQQYIRLPWSEFEPTHGKAVWIAGSSFDGSEEA